MIDTQNDQTLILSLLRNYSVYTLQGPDAETFLQGQTTIDVGRLALGESQSCAHCTPKGKVISSFTLGRVQPNCFVLRVHEDNAETAIAALKKYMLFSKAEIAQTELCCFISEPTHSGAEASTEIYTEKLIAPLQANATYQNRAKNCAKQTEWYVPRSQAAQIYKEVTQNTSTQIIEADWQARLVQQGRAEVRAQTSEVYLPQELNFDLIDAVDFDKGCYIGQEIIARRHYVSQTKKRLYRGFVADATGLKINAQVIDSESGRACGSVVTCAHKHDGCTYFLAVVRIDSVESKRDAELENGEKIQWDELPYAIP